MHVLVNCSVDITYGAFLPQIEKDRPSTVLICGSNTSQIYNKKAPSHLATCYRRTFPKAPISDRGHDESPFVNETPVNLDITCLHTAGEPRYYGNRFPSLFVPLNSS